MAYIWSYLRRYPKWLAMNFIRPFYLLLLTGLLTVLARMIDDGFQCLFDFGDKSTSRSYYFLCGRRTWHTSRIRTWAFVEKLYPNGSFLISETNYNGNPNYTFRKLSGVDSNLSFAYTTK